jgi:hypothetical protein
VARFRENLHRHSHRLSAILANKLMTRVSLIASLEFHHRKYVWHPVHHARVASSATGAWGEADVGLAGRYDPMRIFMTLTNEARFNQLDLRCNRCTYQMRD